jgi:hypothetical protein
MMPVIVSHDDGVSQVGCDPSTSRFQLRVLLALALWAIRSKKLHETYSRRGGVALNRGLEMNRNYARPSSLSRRIAEST